MICSIAGKSPAIALALALGDNRRGMGHSDEKASFLDGLRGLAALIVVFGHCSNAGIHVVPGLNLALIAKIGVWTFFVLSAYLLGRKLLEELESDADVSRVMAAYAIRRVLRILPLYYVFLALLFATGAMDSAGLWRHALLIDGREHFWTIPVEMKFYAVLPFVLMLLIMVPPRLRVLLWAGVSLASVAAYYLFIPPPRIGIAGNPVTLLNYATFFCAGIMVVLIGPLAPRRHYLAVPVGIVALAFVVALSPRPFVQISSLLGWPLSHADVVDLYWLEALALGAAFVALLSLPRFRPLEAMPMRFFGRVSFGMYLTHWFVIPIVVKSAWVPETGKGLTALVATVIVATICYYAIERPMLTLGAAWASDLHQARIAYRPG